MNTNKLPLFLKIFLTLIGSFTAIILPILLYIQAGEIKHSLSLYAISPDCTFIFNASIFIIAISLLVRKIYIIPALLLSMIVIFDVGTYPILHNAIACIFFILLTLIIIYSRKFIYAVLMVLNIIILIFYGIYFFEIIGIFITISYNIEIMFLILKKEFITTK